MKKLIALVLFSLFIVMLLGHGFTKNIVDQSVTQKAADSLVKTQYPQFHLTLFDTFSYFDLDEERIADVYVYAKKGKYNGNKSLLLERLYRGAIQLEGYYEEIAKLRAAASGSEDYMAELGALEVVADKHLRMISGYDDFVTVITSATKNKLPIWEYKEGLPYDYQRHHLESIFLKRNKPLPQATRFYYNGPAQLFIRDMAHSTIINLYNDKVELDLDELAGDVFNNEKQCVADLASCLQTWEDLEAKSQGELIASQSEHNRSSHVISSVPYFRQHVWNNSAMHKLFPAGGSCSVLATASVLFYYDSDYYNMVDLGWMWGGDHQTASAGFAAYSGIGWGSPNPSGQAELKWGPEIALVELAVDIGYNFAMGGTNYSWDEWEWGTRFYTNVRKDLNFTYEKRRRPDLSSYPHTFSEIATQMNNNRPMIMSLQHYSWSNSPPSVIEEIGGHRVCIVAFHDNHSAAGQAIGVYTNGAYDYNVIYWNYENLISAHPIPSPYTMKITPGGSFGDWKSAPNLESPANGSTHFVGDITLSWENVSPINKYLITVGTDASFGNTPYKFQGTVIGNSKTLNFNSTATYYWRVAPYNEKGNLCHFGATYSFTVNSPSVTVYPSSKVFGDVLIGTNSTPQSYTLTGNYLVGIVFVQAPPGYKVSTEQAGPYDTSLTFRHTNGSLSKTIWIMFHPTQAQTYTGAVANGSQSATTVNVAVTGRGVRYLPSFTLYPQSLDFGTQLLYTDTEMSYHITATNLTSHVTVTAPDGYTLSNSQSGTYTSTLTVAADGGIVDATVWVRFRPEYVRDYSGNILHTADNITGVNLPVSGIGLSQVYLPSPLLQIQKISDSVLRLRWSYVPGANLYRVYKSSTGLAGGWELFWEGNSLNCLDFFTSPHAFYHVIAVETPLN